MLGCCRLHERGSDAETDVAETILPGFGKTMKAEYDLSAMKSRRNPYAARLKKPVSMRISEDVIGYFKGMADDAGVPYQSLINLYLRDCMLNKRKVQITWPSAKP